MGPFYQENEHPLYSVLGENILPFSDRKLPKKAKKRGINAARYL